MARAPFPASIPAVAVPRQHGLEAHCLNIKRLNVALDAAALVGRFLNLIPQGATVVVTGAQHQNMGGITTHHAAHGMKRFTFGGRDLPTIYAAPGIDPMMQPLLAGLLGSVTVAERTANLSIDKSLENNPPRARQLQDAVNKAYANVAALHAEGQAMERARVNFDRAILQRLRGTHAGDASYAALLAVYDRVVCGPPGLGEQPARMIDQLLATAR